MNGKLQGDSELLVRAPRQLIWEILIDGSCLPLWMPGVNYTSNKIEGFDTLRISEKIVDGRSGKVQEVCVLYDSPNRIGWEIRYDELAIADLLENYGYTFELIPMEQELTLVVLEEYYNPRNTLIDLINTAFMKYRNKKMRMAMLQSLKTLAESKTQLSQAS